MVDLNVNVRLWNFGETTEKLITGEHGILGILNPTPKAQCVKEKLLILTSSKLNTSSVKVRGKMKGQATDGERICTRCISYKIL